MAYSFHPGRSLDDEIRKVVLGQIDQALERASSRGGDCGERAHKARTGCKKVRAVLRLLRPECKKLAREGNAEFRDAAKLLSPIRDAEVMAACHDQLIDHFSGRTHRRRFAGIRQRLGLRLRAAFTDAGTLQAGLHEFRRRLTNARKRVAGWKLSVRDKTVLTKGLATSYRAARNAMDEVEDGSDSTWHEWRKRVKDYGYHLRLVRRARKRLLRGMRAEIDELSDLLGDDHDLAVYRATLGKHGRDWADARTVRYLVRLIDERRAELQKAARRVGRIALADSPKEVSRRLHDWWDRAAEEH